MLFTAFSFVVCCVKFVYLSSMIDEYSCMGTTYGIKFVKRKELSIKEQGGKYIDLV